MCKKMVALGKYDAHLLQDYTEAEYNEINGYIDHERDLTFSYAAVKQMEGKYLVQNRVTRQIFESPQFLYILVAMCLFAKYPKNTRLGLCETLLRCRFAIQNFAAHADYERRAHAHTPIFQLRVD